MPAQGDQRGLKLTQLSCPTLKFCSLPQGPVKRTSQAAMKMLSALPYPPSNPPDNGCLTGSRCLKIALSNHWLATKLYKQRGKP